MAPINLDLHAGSLLKLAVILLPFYVVGRIFYNLYLHPLRRFPGPFWHRASVLPQCYKLVRGTLPYDVADLHEKYGPVLRLGPNELSFIDADAWRDIYGHRAGALAGVPEFSKSPIFYATRGEPRSIINEPREEHGLLRRQLAHGFSDRSMRLQEPIIGSYVDLLISRLRKNCLEHGDKPTPKVFDLKSWFNWTTFDIVGDLAFGEPFGCLEGEYEHPWVANLNDTITVMGPLQACNVLGIGGIIDAVIRLGLSRSREGHMKRTREKLERRMKLSMERPDLIEGLLRVKNLEEDKIHMNASILIIAGSETTATLLSGAVFLLLTHPDQMQRLVAEVRSSFKDDTEITLSSVSSLTYMLACLDESMRRYPPVPLGLPRTVAPGGGTIAGHEVPENTTVAVWQQACYQSSRNFEDPLVFRPERWLREEGGKSRDKLEAMQGFSVGPRNCIGKNLAYAEMRLILARILYNFDMELVDKEKNWLDHPVWVLRDKPPLDVYLRPVSR